jgi:signal transduction histidine kinase/CheY-like chemotaxis protein
MIAPIPRRQFAQTPANSMSDQPQAQELPPCHESSDAKASPQPVGGKILIVDDQASNLKLLHQTLAQTPCQLIFASSGQQALERVGQVQPDLILLDLFMPEMDGLAVCQTLQQNPATAEIPIIFLTASHETDHLLQAFELGAVDYITKPFFAAELLARVRVHLSLKATQEALDELNQYLDKQVQQRTTALQKAFSLAHLSQRITKKVRETLDEHQICTTVVNELTAALQLGRCHIGLYDLERAMATIAYECVDDLPPNLGKVYAFNQFQEIYAPLHEGQLAQCQLETNASHQVSKATVLLACPLCDQDDIIGDIWLYRTGSNHFSDDEVGLVEQITDQTAIALRQARLYQSSQAQVEELEQLNYAKDEFLKTISHELKTPLTSVKMAADTLQTIWQNPRTLEHHQQAAAQLLPVVTEGCDREIKLVNTLLEFVQLDTQTAAKLDDIIDPREVLDHLATVFQHRCSAKQLTFELAIATPLPLMQTNAEILSRLLNEILDNAYKYTPPGETIILKTGYEDQQIFIQVSNSGVTLSETNLNHLFDRFYRVPRQNRWAYSGVGLGLALVKKQVEYLGGAISAVTKPNQLTLHVKLPALPLES